MIGELKSKYNLNNAKNDIEQEENRNDNNESKETAFSANTKMVFNVKPSNFIKFLNKICEKI